MRKVRDWWVFAVSCLFMGVVLGQVGAYRIVVVFLPFIIIWGAVNLFRARNDPKQCRGYQIKMGIWLALIVATGLLHLYYAMAARSAANAAAETINDFRKHRGRFPAEQELFPRGLPQDWEQRRVRYVLSRDAPVLTYTATDVAYDRFRYDFEQGDWVRMRR